MPTALKAASAGDRHTVFGIARGGALTIRDQAEDVTARKRDGVDERRQNLFATGPRYEDGARR